MKNPNLISEKELLSKVPISQRVLEHYQYNSKIISKKIKTEEGSFFDREEILALLGIKDLEEPFLTQKQAANLLGINPAQVWLLTSDGSIPSYSFNLNKKGANSFYRKSELEAVFTIHLNSVGANTLGKELITKKYLNFVYQNNHLLSDKEKQIFTDVFVVGESQRNIGKKMDLSGEMIRLYIKDIHKKNLVFLQDLVNLPIAFAPLKLRMDALEKENILLATLLREQKEKSLTAEEMLQPIAGALIESSPLSDRIKNCCKSAGIFTVGHLALLSRKELKNIPKLGPTAIAQIGAYLQKQIS